MLPETFVPVLKVGRNERGRDLLVGDIHGCFSRLQAALDELGFDPEKDRLFSVGDLVDRGPESEKALEWLGKPWFYAVRGNHEQMAIDFVRYDGADRSVYAMNGGAWNIANLPHQRKEFAQAFSLLPIAIELELNEGSIGIVHADCQTVNWPLLEIGLSGENKDGIENCCLWDRSRIQRADPSGVDGIRAVIVGHTPLKQVARLGNVIYIDTGAVFGGPLTILDANTLQPA